MTSVAEASNTPTAQGVGVIRHDNIIQVVRADPSARYAQFLPFTLTRWKKLLAVLSDKDDNRLEMHSPGAVFYTADNLTTIARQRTGKVVWSGKGYGATVLEFSDVEWRLFRECAMQGKFDVANMTIGEMRVATSELAAASC